MSMAIVLIFLGALSRLVPHLPNEVAMGALALYAGARLPRRWAFVVPLAAMALSDLVIDWGHGRSVISFNRVIIYGTFVLIVALGRLPRSDAGPVLRVAMSLIASTVFFITSNFAVWAWDGMYPLTGTGLLACYTAGLPFFRYTVRADLVGTAVLFGVDAVAVRVGARLRAARGNAG
jgi:hypothetical protein